MPRIDDKKSPYYIDNPARVKAIQAAMRDRGLVAYLGTRPRTLSWVLDAFCPWHSYLIIPASGDPVVFTFVVDSARLADETWLPQDDVRAYAPMGGQDQVSCIANYLVDELGLSGGKLGVETGISVYTPEGNLTKYEWDALEVALPGFELVNSHEIVDELQLIKDAPTVARFREASRIVDCGQAAARAALEGGGWKGMTETVIAGIAALAMRREGSVSEWNFAGLNEISSGYRTGLGACTPPTTREFRSGEPLMLDFHSMFKLALGDHSHNYLIGPASAAAASARGQLRGPRVHGPPRVSRGTYALGNGDDHERARRGPALRGLHHSRLRARHWPVRGRVAHRGQDRGTLPLLDRSRPRSTPRASSSSAPCSMPPRTRASASATRTRFSSPSEGCEALSKFPLAIEEIA